MKFTEYERKEFRINTLYEVIFQARFPEIFKIANSVPVEFQEAIRQDYPETATPPINQLPVGLPINQMPQELQNLLGVNNKEYQFLNEGGTWRVSLHKNFIALSSIGSYVNYEDFEARVRKIMDVLHTVYKPSYYTRVGLRYRNAVCKEILGIEEADWKTLIPKETAPELWDDSADELEIFDKISQYKDNEKNGMTVMTAFQMMSGILKGKTVNSKTYLIDTDCFNEEKTRDVDNVLTKTREFRKWAGSIFIKNTTPALRDLLDRSEPSNAKE